MNILKSFDKMIYFELYFSIKVVIGMYVFGSGAHNTQVNMHMLLFIKIMKRVSSTLPT